MITTINLKQFRGFKELNIDGLKRINLIAGKNNCGKSSLLEAVFLYHDHASLDFAMKLAAFRRNSFSLTATDLWKPLFYQLDMDNDIMLQITDAGQDGILSFSVDQLSLNHVYENNHAREHSLSSPDMNPLTFEFQQGEYEEHGKFLLDGSGVRLDLKTNQDNNVLIPLRQARFINAGIVRGNGEIVEWFSRQELKGKKAELVNIMSVIEPDIEDIITTVINGQPQLHIKTGHGTMPLDYAGDGMYKLMYLLLAIMEKEQSVVLVDEIETGLHYSMYGKMWELLGKVSRENNAQLILTTHSYEVVVAAVEDMDDTFLDDFSFYRLSKQNDECRAMYYDRQLLATALNTEMEIR